MRHRPTAAISIAALLVLAGCTGDDPPTGQRGVTPSAAPTDVGPDSAVPTHAGTAQAEPSATPPLATGAGPDGPEERALLDLARAEGSVSVVVEAHLDDDAEPGSAHHSRLVARARDALEAELDPDHAQVTTRFDRSARLTLTVDEAGLHALFASPRVRNVWENRTIPLD